ncbi:MAG: hypothetical protein AAF585_26430 [Verrucomicrobiota bacterium]
MKSSRRILAVITISGFTILAVIAVFARSSPQLIAPPTSWNDFEFSLAAELLYSFEPSTIVDPSWEFPKLRIGKRAAINPLTLFHAETAIAAQVDHFPVDGFALLNAQLRQFGDDIWRQLTLDLAV